MILSRRGLLGSLLAAPAIVSASSLMRLSAPRGFLTLDEFHRRYWIPAQMKMLEELAQREAYTLLYGRSAYEQTLSGLSHLFAVRAKPLTSPLT